MNFWPKLKPVTQVCIAAATLSVIVSGTGVAIATPGIFTETYQTQSINVVATDNSVSTPATSGTVLNYAKVEVKVVTANIQPAVTEITETVNESLSAEPVITVTPAVHEVEEVITPITVQAETIPAPTPVVPAAGTVEADTTVPAVCTDIKPGQAWAGAGTVCKPLRDSTTPPPPTKEEYAHLVRNIVAPYCGYVNVLVDDPSVVSGDIYGMSWWGTNKIGIRSGIPMAITKDMALHECGHILQARVFPNKQDAVNRLNALHGTNYAIETNARCISAYLHPGAQPVGVGTGATARWYSAECAGVAGESAIKIIQGIRP